MAIFKRKRESVEERLAAVNDRLGMIKSKVQNKEAGINEAREVLAKALGNLALQENEENQSAVSRAKKAVERQSDGLDDLRTMVAALQIEKNNLGQEILEVIISEAAPKAETMAESYNALLEHAFKALAILRTLHAQMLAAQSVFNGLLTERAKCLQHLGLMQPLDMTVGLGTLAVMKTPFRQSYQTAEDFRNYLSTLIGYEKKVQDYESFTRANPNYEKKQDEAQNKGLTNPG